MRSAAKIAILGCCLAVSTCVWAQYLEWCLSENCRLLANVNLVSLKSERRNRMFVNLAGRELQRRSGRIAKSAEIDKLMSGPLSVPESE